MFWTVGIRNIRNAFPWLCGCAACQVRFGRPHLPYRGDELGSVQRMNIKASKICAQTKLYSVYACYFKNPGSTRSWISCCILTDIGRSSSSRKGYWRHAIQYFLTETKQKKQKKSSKPGLCTLNGAVSAASLRSLQVRKGLGGGGTNIIRILLI